MTGYEIIILLSGFVFVVASFFLGGKNSAREKIDTDAEIRKIKEAAVLHEGEIRDRLNALLSQECNGAVDDVREKLSQISNDKIMAIDEYASQMLEKIENNNQSVVFLYDMLQKKEDEMKSTMNKMEQTRRENKELFDRLEELKQAKARVASRNAAKKAAQNSTQTAMEQTPASKKGLVEKGMALSSQAKMLVGRQVMAMQKNEQTAMRNELSQSTQELEHTQAGALTEFAPKSAQENAAQNVDTQFFEEFPVEPEVDRQEQVLALYQEHKSIKDISKQLSMGQGEVKLIIDLYAKQSE